MLKSDSHLPKNNCLFTSMIALKKMMKNAFYFTLKALFVLKIFKGAFSGLRQFLATENP